MVGAIGRRVGVSSWGWIGEHRLWRIRWNDKPGWIAQVTGPLDAVDALMKCSDEKVLARLPWVPAPDESTGLKYKSMRTSDTFVQAGLDIDDTVEVMTTKALGGIWHGESIEDAVRGAVATAVADVYLILDGSLTLDDFRQPGDG